MLSINTNLSSLIAQQSLSSSTAKLNQAIERMSTGFKINHAKDNAANYSISTNMSTQIGAYDVAANNVAMGMDLVTTASDIISTMQDHATRLQALSTQARNGTYGEQSLAAINSEAGAIMAEINRLYSTAEYNGISLFNRTAYDIPGVSNLARAANTHPVANEQNGGFIADFTRIEDSVVNALTAVSDATLTSGGTYKVDSKEDLIALAEFVNDGNSTENMTFIMSKDIDMTGVDWTPIGDFYDNYYYFEGTFDGNGHTIYNLKIDKDQNGVGLFGYVYGATILNVALKDVDIDSEAGCVGGLVGFASSNTTITNSYVTGSVLGGYSSVAGLVGAASDNIIITNSYTTGSVKGNDDVGGLVGYAYNNTSITNSYATGNVNGNNNVGGLVGYAEDGTITNCYTTGNVSGNSAVGGLVGVHCGASYATIINSYATGSVKGDDSVGGLVGRGSSYPFSITNSYATGSVEGNNSVGGLVGYAYDLTEITNCYTMSNVSGNSAVGGLVGYGYGELTISDSINYSTVTGTNRVGAVVGSYIHTYSELELNNVSTINTDLPVVAYYYNNNMLVEEPDKALAYEAVVTRIPPRPVTTTLQVGINSDSSCQISFDTNFGYDLSTLEGNIASDEAFRAITEFINLLSERSTQLGAVQNRLDSALESIEVNLENLVSSRSTIRDADIAEESSAYIRQQILQQASATLLATANQSPSIALQLI